VQRVAPHHRLWKKKDEGIAFIHLQVSMEYGHRYFVTLLLVLERVCIIAKTGRCLNFVFSISFVTKRQVYENDLLACVAANVMFIVVFNLFSTTF